MLENIELSPSMYKLAEERYKAVGNYLNKFGYDVEIYPQGSFRLGTTVRPFRDNKDADYDIDLVVEIGVEKADTDPKEIKNHIGKALKKDKTYLNMLEKEKKRCWTLKYAEQNNFGFHLDILPAVKEDIKIIQRIQNNDVPPNIASNAIAVTDKIDDDYLWSSSNSRGYGIWFDNINKPLLEQRLNEEKRVIREANREIFDSIDDVPDQLVKTPLQKVIQILKRHRDIRFTEKGNEKVCVEKNKPISIIITTLVVKIVEELNLRPTNTYEFLEKIILELQRYNKLFEMEHSQFSSINNLIKRDSTGDWKILNPVNPEENFAEKWSDDNNIKAKAFFQWLSFIKVDLIDNLYDEKYSIYLNENLGIETSSELKITSQDKPTRNVIITQPTKPWSISND